MNVFYLHENPVTCAQMHLDKHASKMCVEYAQLMSTAHRVVDGNLWYGRTTNGRRIARYFHPDSVMNQSLYTACHINHPSNLWVRHSQDNYNWLYEMWTALCAEYTHRYGRTHESFRKLEYYLLIAPIKLEQKGFTQPPPAMKSHEHCIVKDDSITSYRNYYWEAKRDFAKWTRREPPQWWKERLLNERKG